MLKLKRRIIKLIIENLSHDIAVKLFLKGFALFGFKIKKPDNIDCYNNNNNNDFRVHISVWHDTSFQGNPQVNYEIKLDYLFFNS